MRLKFLIISILVLFSLNSFAGKTISIPEEEMKELGKHIDNLIKRDSINNLIIAELKTQIDSLKKYTAGNGTADTTSLSQQPYCTDTIQAKDQGSLWSFALIAFVAGLLALITPCVFPMVPMTVTFFTRSSTDAKTARRKALIYGASIIVIYAIIAIPLAIINGPDFANLLSTHWIPNIFFTLIFLVFGISFLGFFEITLPSSLVNKVDQQSEKGGLLGIFFMAFTIALVSFSCTGPIVGFILVEASGDDKIKPIVGMISYATAFAIPFTLFAMFPNMMNKIPKSGGWLNIVKVSLGFVELALAFKFLSIADQVYHWNILPRELYLIIWILISLAFALFLLGIMPMPGGKKEKFTWGKAMLALLPVAFAGYLITGLNGAPLNTLSGYLPPKIYNHANIPALVEDFKIGRTSPICDMPKYSDKLHLPHGLVGYFDYKQAIECARAQKKPLFIDFTGHGCVNCREMEANVWSDPKVLERLRTDFVVVALYVDERTELPLAEQFRSPFDNKIKTTVGKLNADLQVRQYGQNAQPYYVLLDPYTEKVLVNPVAYNPSVDNFVNFLDNGKACFKDHIK